MEQKRAELLAGCRALRTNVLDAGFYKVSNLFYLFRRHEYDRDGCIVICRSKEPFGGLLNMAAGFPLVVNGVTFNSLEHLYQCLRFPNLPGIQRRINSKASPLVAKWIAKPHREKGRGDWFELKILMMNWALHVKLAQHYERFGALLDSTGEKIIVETSPDGDFWGGIPSPRKSKPDILVGSNVFGKLLMQLREEYQRKSRSQLIAVAPLSIPDFCLFGRPIEEIRGSGGQS